MARAALFEPDAVVTGPRSRCRELVPLSRESCLVCDGPLRRETVAQPALLRHGGYGATRQETFVLCVDEECGWVRLANTIEVRPDRRR